ncbi:MAG: cupin domain-containing protein [Candidatus Scalindua sp.]|nr:cupin domain-containing protein [Candidatus Scalindua sp.]
MQKNSLANNLMLLVISASIFSVCGCMGAKKSGEFVESLRNPTSFPEIFLPEIKYIDDIVEEKSMAEDENILIIPLGNDKSTSVYLYQIRQGSEMDTHYHKTHDEILYIKRGSGIIDLDGSRHIVKEGMIVMIPRQTVHKYMNTGKETSITVSMFSPPFDGKDIKVFKNIIDYKKKKKNVYDKMMEKSVKELEKEEGKERKWFGLRKKDEDDLPDESEEGDFIPEEQKILVLTNEGREKIREARKKVTDEENAIIDKIILDEKLIVLQRLKLDGLISEEEFEKTKAEIIEESRLSN